MASSDEDNKILENHSKDTFKNIIKKIEKSGFKRKLL